MPDPRDTLINRLLSYIQQIDDTLRVPAAEYVPAIRDAWRLCDAAKGEAAWMVRNSTEAQPDQAARERSEHSTAVTLSREEQ